MNTSFRCVLAGGESLLIQCAELLMQRGHQVVGVVSARAAIRQWAAKQGIRVLKDAAALKQASDLLPFDYLFSVTNLAVLDASVLALPTRGAINFHDGPLPEYAGLNTPVWALLHGAGQHGITWHTMTAEVDRGDILAERRFDLTSDETSLTLNTKNYGAAIEAFETLMDGLQDGSLQGRPQDRPIEKYFGRKDRPAGMAMLDWRDSADVAARLVRALDFGTYANPVASAKVSVGGRTLRVTRARVGPSEGGAPGQIVSVTVHGMVVACGQGQLVLEALETLSGRALSPTDAASHWGVAVGQSLDLVPDDVRQQLGDANTAMAPHEGFWVRRLETHGDYELPYVDRKAVATTPSPTHLDALHGRVTGATPEREGQVASAVLLVLARLADKDQFDIGWMPSGASTNGGWMRQLVSPQWPLRTTVDFAQRADQFMQSVGAEIALLRKRVGFVVDVVGRTPELRQAATQRDPTHHAIVIQWVNHLDDAQAAVGAELTIAFDREGTSSRWFFDASQLAAAHVQAMQAQVNLALDGLALEPHRLVGEVPLVDAVALHGMAVGWNQTAAEVPTEFCVHHLFEQQVARTPDQTAVTAQGVSITYAELDRRANQLARRLASLGVKPDVMVGLMCERSIELMVGLVAIHKAGGAYVPLDPTYPRDRIAYMVEDAKAPVLLTLEHLRGDVSVPTHTHVIAIDGDWQTIALESPAAFDGGAQPQHLAYVIYTSGSTGKPKGVMVEHRNAVNFFVGMDQHLGADGPGTWLAVTSLSFDISVLELCWTLARGFHVVMSSDEDRSVANPTRGEHASRPLDFSLFYFSSDESEGVTDKYKLLLEGAKYGDQHGFTAVWTPERHFHAFGGLYPNPAVTGAAIAAITKKVQIRSGSVVLPLHHPLRVAEEWSVVDNISKGRVGLSFASGWQPDDFVLMPQNFKDNKAIMLRNIELVRSLWRGNAHAFDGPLGKPVEVRVLPRPVQKELPFWVTSAGNPDTFAAAGKLGANVLTHLLGQSVEELRGKLAVYRQAWKDAGHPGEGYVSLMLHTFVGQDEAYVRDKVKQPLIEYLRSSANLVKQYAWAFPAFKRRDGMDTQVDAVDLSTVSKEEMDALLEFSFERYYESSGLFGTPESCLKIIDAIKGIGVDDVACLIDFGVDSTSVLENLPNLNALRKLSKPPRASSPEFALPALMQKHQATHLQCTPSMARMLLLDEAAKPGLAQLKRMMVGGEALQPQLAKELTSLVQGQVMNMYGPTETTIWSAVHTLDKRVDGPIPLGRPLANQAIYILDRRQQPLPVGVPGELVIGGQGVVRGYLHRPELTAEKFLNNPLAGKVKDLPPGRVYRTGDLARWREDGTVEFLGRLDHQVKVRGYRIELGEIEALVAKHPSVSETVVMAREDSPGDVRLVAYLVPKPGLEIAVADLKESLREGLPDFMVPAHFVTMPSFPQTPNGKIDRKQLPAPDVSTPVVDSSEAYVAPTGDLEAQIVEVWKDVLKVPQVGVRDNFFDLGGHSLLAIQVLRSLKETLQRNLAITDIFRFPTVQALAAHLSDGASEGAAAKEGQDRAQGRRAAMARRAGARETSPS